jgi:hypothetical protein
MFSPVGGVIANPMRYRLSTAAAWVKATIYNSTGTQLATMRVAARAGEAVVDVSGMLRNYVKAQVPVMAGIVQKDNTAYLGYYCDFESATGETLSDAANVRYAVRAALPYGQNYHRYTLDQTEAPTLFNSQQERPILEENYPLSLGLAINETPRVLYLEREYLNANRQQILIRATPVTDRKAMINFNIHEPPPPAGTRYINASLTNQNRSNEELLLWFDHEIWDDSTIWTE